MDPLLKGLWLLPRSFFVLEWEAGRIVAGVITALKVQQRNKNRVNVFIDDEYAFSLHSMLAARLRHDQRLDDDDIAELRRLDATEMAYEWALHYLTFRPRSCFEVEQYLRRKGIEEQVTEVVLGRLRRAGLVDDQAFARFWVENREAFRPRGALGLGVELRQKGVSSEIIAEATRDLDEEASALSAAEPRVARLAHLDEVTFRRRLLGFLQRRGFGYQVARNVTERLWRECVAGREAAPDPRVSPDNIDS